MRPLIVVRPEPGASATAGRARAMGLTVEVMPLFAVWPLPWHAPDAQDFDALLVTSASAMREGGKELGRLRHLPVMAVGAATAAAAAEQGFTVQRVGSSGVDALLDGLPAALRLLHLAGRDRTAPAAGRKVHAIDVYEAVALPPPRDLAAVPRPVVALHSPRAAERFSELAGSRSTTAIVALSPAVAEAAGAGWERVVVAEAPTDTALLALAAELCLEAAE